MDLERLAYLALRVIVKSEKRQGQIRSVLKSQNIPLSDLDAREVGRFIETKRLGNIIHLPLGEVLVIANLQAVDFINKLSNMTFEQKLKLVYSELESLPDKKGELQTILNRLGIEPTAYVVSEFVSSFRETGNVKIVAESKDGYEIVLTQKGEDALRAPVENPVQPQIHIQDNPNSIINIGGTQSGSFESGIKKDNAVINKTPSENPSNKNKPASPTKTWQIIGVIVSVIGVSLTILKAFNLI